MYETHSDVDTHETPTCYDIVFHFDCAISNNIYVSDSLINSVVIINCKWLDIKELFV